MIYELFGVITEIGEPGTAVVCEPVFMRRFKNNQAKYYLKKNNEFIETSISQYERIYMPTQILQESKGKCIIIFNSKYVFSEDKKEKLLSQKIRDNDDKDEYFWIPTEITVGVIFPEQFVILNKNDAGIEELIKNHI